MTDETIQEFANQMLIDRRKLHDLMDVVAQLELRLEEIEKVME